MDRIIFGSTLLKVVVFVQIVLSTWGYLLPGGPMPATYVYSHSILVLFGALSIIKPNSTDAIIMYLAVNIFTILNDMMLLGIYQPSADDEFEERRITLTQKNTYRFTLGMSILNLILKPVVCFILYKIYLNRGGNLTSELVSITVSSNGHTYNSYDNIEDSSKVETAPAHHSIDHSPSQSG